VSAGLLERRGRGRPPRYSRELIVRIIELHRQGLSYERISMVLNDEGVPMPGGGSRWLKSSVDRLLHTKYAREILEDSQARGWW
jgi:hypothetical protein